MLKTRQATVDNFLLKIAAAATNDAAAERAEAEIEELAEKIDLNDEGLSTADQAAKIVHGFMIPEVIKREKMAKFDQDRQDSFQGLTRAHKKSFFSPYGDSNRKVYFKSCTLEVYSKSPH